MKLFQVEGGKESDKEGSQPSEESKLKQYDDDLAQELAEGMLPKEAATQLQDAYDKEEFTVQHAILKRMAIDTKFCAAVVHEIKNS